MSPDIAGHVWRGVVRFGWARHRRHGWRGAAQRGSEREAGTSNAMQARPGYASHGVTSRGVARGGKAGGERRGEDWLGRRGNVLHGDAMQAALCSAWHDNAGSGIAGGAW